MLEPQETQVRSLGGEDPLEKEMATHSNILAWKIPWTEDPGWLQTMGYNIPGSYAILLFTASDLASVTSHIHSWVLFLLWLHPFILSGVISPLISSSILGS